MKLFGPMQNFVVLDNFLMIISNFACHEDQQNIYQILSNFAGQGLTHYPFCFNEYGSVSAFGTTIPHLAFGIASINMDEFMHLWNWCKQSGWIIIYTLDLLVSFVNIFLRFKSEHYFFRCSMFRYCTHAYMSIVIVVRWTICWKLNWYIYDIRHCEIYQSSVLGSRPVKKWEDPWKNGKNNEAFM